MPIPDRPDYTNTDLELKDDFGGTKQDYTTEEKTSGYQLGKPLGLIPKSVNYNYILNYVNKWIKYNAESSEYLFPNIEIFADSGSENNIIINSQSGQTYTPYEYTDIGAAKIVRTVIDQNISYETGFFNERRDISITEFKGSQDIQNTPSSENILKFTVKIEDVSDEALWLLKEGMTQTVSTDFKNSFVRDYANENVYINFTVNMDGQRYSFEKCLIHYLTYADYGDYTNAYFVIKAYRSEYLEEVYNQRAEYTIVAKRPIGEMSSINIDPAVFYQDPISLEYPLVDKITEAKFKRVRFDVSWASVETVAGVYDFTSQDLVHAGIISRGLIPIYILAYGNPLYTTYIDGVTSIQNQTEADAYIAFCEEVVNRYKDDGVLFEIWNEPNIEFFWKPQTNSNALYYELAKQTYTAIKAIDSNITVLAPAVDSLKNEDSISWLIELIDRGVLDYCDFLSVHTYQFDLPELTFPSITELYNYIYGYFPEHKDKKIISSEDGLFYRWGPYNDPEDGPGQDTQLAYLIRRLVVNAYSGAYITNIYELADSDEIIAGADYYGLLDSSKSSLELTGQPVTEHLSFGAIKEFHTELEDMWLEQRLDSVDTGDALALFTDGTNYKICYWAGGYINPRELQLTPTKTVLIDWIPKYTDITMQELIDYFNYI